MPGESLLLRHPLLEHYDFEAVPPTVWRYLRAWYGCDASVARLLVKDKSAPKAYVLDLYPRGLRKQSSARLTSQACRQISKEVKQGLV